jgi:hypothetical protein
MKEILGEVRLKIEEGRDGERKKRGKKNVEK